MVGWMYYGAFREGADAEEWEFRDRLEPGKQDKSSYLESVLGPLGSDDITPYLESLGYDMSAWGSKGASSSQPRLNLGVDSHSELDGHTWYRISCHLTHPGRRHWSLERRLMHIRRFLHDPVKEEL